MSAVALESVVTEARRLLAQAAARVERGWTQNVWAREPGGRAVDARDPKACAWCAQGAVWAGQPEHDSLSPSMLAGRAATLIASRRMGTAHLPYWDMVLYNEEPGTTQAEVVSLLQEAEQLLADYPGLARVPLFGGTQIKLGWVEELLRLAEKCALP